MAEFKLEISIVGAMVNSESCKIIGIQKISKKDIFEHEISRIIFQSIYEMFIAQEEIDAFSLKDKLVKKKQFEAIGSDFYKEVVSQKLSTPNFEQRVRKLQDDFLYRSQVETAKDILSKATEKSAPPYELMLEAIRSLESSLRFETEDTSKAIGKLLKEMMYSIESPSAATVGLSTGYSAVDNYFTYLEGDLIVIGARSSMGKTAFLLQLLRKLSLERNIPTAVFSMEMDAMRYTKRIACGHLKINSYALKHNLLNDSDKNKIYNFCNSFATAPLFIDDDPYYDANSMLARIIVLAITKKIRVFAIDYIGLVRLVYQNRQQTKSDATGDFTSALKKLARKLGITIIALQQLSRDVDKRPNPRPVLSDLRDSGSIEQDADVVAFLYRPDYYPANIFEPKSKEEKEKYGEFAGKHVVAHYGREGMKLIDMAGKCELIIAKNRDGATGRIFFDYNKGYGSFEYDEKLSSIINNQKTERDDNNIF